MEPILSEEELEYLRTKEGKRFFASISGDMSRQAINVRLRSFVDPPENVKRWIRTRSLIQKQLTVEGESEDN